MEANDQGMETTGQGGGGNNNNNSNNNNNNNRTVGGFSIKRLRVILCQKKNERTKKMALRRKQRERLRNLNRELATTEAEIKMLDDDIIKIEAEEKKADDEL